MPKKGFAFGGVAQLGERLLCTQEVIGSIPFTSTNSKLAISGHIYSFCYRGLSGNNDL